MSSGCDHALPDRLGGPVGRAWTQVRCSTTFADPNNDMKRLVVLIAIVAVCGAVGCDASPDEPDESGDREVVEEDEGAADQPKVETEGLEFEPVETDDELKREAQRAVAEYLEVMNREQWPAHLLRHYRQVDRLHLHLQSEYGEGDPVVEHVAGVLEAVEDHERLGEKLDRAREFENREAVRTLESQLQHAHPDDRADLMDQYVEMAAEEGLVDEDADLDDADPDIEMPDFRAPMFDFDQ